MTDQEARDGERARALIAEVRRREFGTPQTTGPTGAMYVMDLASALADALEVVLARKSLAPEVTDEMVERAALRVFADNWSDRPDLERAKRRWDRDPEHYMATYGAQARAYLEAALNPKEAADG